MELFKDKHLRAMLHFRASNCSRKFIFAKRKIPQLEIVGTPELNICCFALKDGSDEDLEKMQKLLLQEKGIYFSSPTYEGRKLLRAIPLNPFTNIDDVIQAIKEVLSVSISAL